MPLDGPVYQAVNHGLVDAHHPVVLEGKVDLRHHRHRVPPLVDVGGDHHVLGGVRPDVAGVIEVGGVVQPRVLAARLRGVGGGKLLQLVGGQVVEGVEEVDLVLGDGVHSVPLVYQILNAVGPHIQQLLVIGAQLDLSGLLVGDALDAGGRQPLAHGDDLSDVAQIVLVGDVVKHLGVPRAVLLLPQLDAGLEAVLLGNGLHNVQVDAVAVLAHILLEVAQQNAVEDVNAPVILYNVRTADLPGEAHVGLDRVENSSVELAVHHRAFLAGVAAGAADLLQQLLGGTDVHHRVALDEFQGVHDLLLLADQRRHLLREGLVELLVLLAQILQIVRTQLVGGQFGSPISQGSDVGIVVCETGVELGIDALVSAQLVQDGGVLPRALLGGAQLIQVLLLLLASIPGIKGARVVGVGGVVFQVGGDDIVDLRGHTVDPLIHLHLHQVEHIPGGIGMADVSEGVFQYRLQAVGLVLVDGLGLIDEQGLRIALRHLLGILLDDRLIVPQQLQVLPGLALHGGVVLVVDLLREVVGHILGPADGGVTVQALVHLVGQSLEILAHPLLGVPQELVLQILGEGVGAGLQLADVHLAAFGDLRIGQPLLAGLPALDLEGIVVPRPLGCLALAADAGDGPVVGHIVCNVLVGIAQHTRADAAEPVAPKVAGVRHLLDDVVLHGKRLFLHGADVLLIQGLGRLQLVLVQAHQGAVLRVLPVQQEAEVEGQQGQGSELIGAGVGEVNVQVAVPLQVLVDVKEPGALHHKGVDLLDGGIGISSLAVSLHRGVNDAVQRLGQHHQSPHNQAGVGVLVLYVVPDQHSQGQHDAGAGAARGGGGDDAAHGLLHGLSGLAEQLVDGIIQGADFPRLYRAVQGQTGDGTHLSGALGHGLVVEHRIFGKPVLQRVLVVVQVVAHRLGVGGLHRLDGGLALGHPGQIIHVGVQAHKADVFYLSRPAHFGHHFDDVASGSAYAYKQSRGIHHIVFDDFSAHLDPSIFHCQNG